MSTYILLSPSSTVRLVGPFSSDEEAFHYTELHLSPIEYFWSYVDMSLPPGGILSVPVEKPIDPS